MINHLSIYLHDTCYKIEPFYHFYPAGSVIALAYWIHNFKNRFRLIAIKGQQHHWPIINEYYYRHILLVMSPLFFFCFFCFCFLFTINAFEIRHAVWNRLSERFYGIFKYDWVREGKEATSPLIKPCINDVPELAL